MNDVPHTAKALELFLGMIVDEASKVTVERGSKKVEAYHLCVPLFSSRGPQFLKHTLCRKHAIDTVDVLDFLKEIVEAVPDPSAGGTIDLVAEAAEKAAAKKKSRRKPVSTAEGGPATPARRRRKKEDVAGKGKGRKDEDEEEGMEDRDEPEPEEEEYTGNTSRKNEDDEDWEG